METEEKGSSLLYILEIRECLRMSAHIILASASTDGATRMLKWPRALAIEGAKAKGLLS